MRARNVPRVGIHSWLRQLCVTLLLLVAFSATVRATTPTPVPCVGDCDGDAVVTVDEVVIGVSIMLGIAPLTGCTAFNRDGDDVLTVDELMAAVANVLGSCPQAVPPTSTPTPSSVPTLSPTPFPPAIRPPDLTLTVDVVTSSRDCALSPEDQPRLLVRVLNCGTLAARPFSVSLNDTEQWRVNGLDGGSTVDLYAPFVAAGEVTVDAAREVLEIHEHDNSVLFTFEPPPHLPPCAPGARHG